MNRSTPLSWRERLDRSRARAWILQVLYRWESGSVSETLSEALEDTVATRRISPRRIEYVTEIVRLIEEHLPELDRELRLALDNWRLDRLSAIDRGILRLAAAEMLFRDDIPPKVSIQEAVRLAETYGGPESPRFVNGVLDALYRKGGEGGRRRP
ncbi:MAG: transcription antitermination factor NusB [Gemmatimonadota bacterium]